MVRKFYEMMTEGRGMTDDEYIRHLSDCLQHKHNETASLRADYGEIFSDHKRIARELDVVINGENAAIQASLCDILSQLKKELPALRAELEAAKQRVVELEQIINDWPGLNAALNPIFSPPQTK